MYSLLIILTFVDLGVTNMKSNTRHTLDLPCAKKLIYKLDPFKQQIYCIINYTKIERKPLFTEQEYLDTPQNTQERNRKQNVSSRQKLKDELGCLLLSLLQCYSDDDRERLLHFIETTLRHYIQLIDKY